MNVTVLFRCSAVMSAFAIGQVVHTASAQEPLAGSSISAPSSESITVLEDLEASTNAESTTEPESVGEATDAPRDNLWCKTLDAAIEQARERERPILAIVGARWCVFCNQLDQELAGVEQELAQKWVLAKIDADAHGSDARELRANGLPSIRLLSKDGVIGAAEDGYMELDVLRNFLDRNYESVQHEVPEFLEIAPSEFTAQQVRQLVTMVSTRDVTTRRIIIDRLSKIPERCLVAVIDLLESERLADQLSAMQLLRQWGAPVVGLDPWIPGSIDQKTVEGLREWGNQTFPDAIVNLQ